MQYFQFFAACTVLMFTLCSALPTLAPGTTDALAIQSKRGKLSDSRKPIHGEHLSYDSEYLTLDEYLGPVQYKEDLSNESGIGEDDLTRDEVQANGAVGVDGTPIRSKFCSMFSAACRKAKKEVIQFGTNVRDGVLSPAMQGEKYATGGY